MVDPDESLLFLSEIPSTRGPFPIFRFQPVPCICIKVNRLTWRGASTRKIRKQWPSRIQCNMHNCGTIYSRSQRKVWNQGKKIRMFVHPPLGDFNPFLVSWSKSVHLKGHLKNMVLDSSIVDGSELPLPTLVNIMGYKLPTSTPQIVFPWYFLGCSTSNMGVLSLGTTIGFFFASPASQFVPPLSQPETWWVFFFSTRSL